MYTVYFDGIADYLYDILFIIQHLPFSFQFLQFDRPLCSYILSISINKPRYRRKSKSNKCKHTVPPSKTQYNELQINTNTHVTGLTILGPASGNNAPVKDLKTEFAGNADAE